MAQITLVAVSKDKSQAVLINGCRWAEADGLYTQEVTTEFTGKTSGKVSFFNKIPVTAG